MFLWLLCVIPRTDAHLPMDDSTQSLSADYLSDVLDEGAYEDAVEYVERFQSEPVDERRESLRTIRSLLEHRPSALDPLLPALTSFLTDSERSIRLRTAKIFVSVAKNAPLAAEPAVSPLAARLADEDEFYYVRARAAEALGYVALECPDAVASPEILAELRVGLSFDASEVKEKLAKALEYVALGNPARLRHQLSSLSEHFADESELVRYHLVTTAAVVGCECPEALVSACAALTARLDDESPFVRGRAAEALGVLGRSTVTDWSPPNAKIAALETDDDAFVAERARFAVAALDDENTTLSGGDNVTSGVGTIQSIRETTDDAVDEITSPDSACPNCGLALPEAGPPMCPQCGAPY